MKNAFLEYIFETGSGADRNKTNSQVWDGDQLNMTAKHANLYQRIRQILELARSNVARSVNTTQVIANWLVGREIVEEEQQGAKRAAYGGAILNILARRLQKEYGEGYSARNLRFMRKFYIEYVEFLPESMIWNALRTKSEPQHRLSVIGKRNVPRTISWKPGKISVDLSWTHYRTLLRVESLQARAFYEIEAIQNNWGARELERQINSLLYERLALSKDKRGVMKLATKGQIIQKPADVFKEPVMIEFLGLPESHKLVESDLEQALLGNLQNFLLELGKGFAFVARQERLTLDGDHFYVDLVFYHTILKCYILIDLKTGKLTHADLGQLQLYVNYFDMERRSQGDAPTLGLILCADKNDAMVKYLLGDKKEKNIFTRHYQLNLPTVAELKAELRRELKQLKTD